MWKPRISNGGVNLFSDVPLKDGAGIYVRVDSCLSSDHSNDCGGCAGMRTVGVAEVKWCKKIPTAHGPFYSIGLRYYEPAV